MLKLARNKFCPSENHHKRKLVLCSTKNLCERHKNGFAQKCFVKFLHNMFCKISDFFINNFKEYFYYANLFLFL